MGLRAGPILTALDRRCLGLFEEELDYVFESLRRLGAGAKESETLAAQAFAAFYRAWPDLYPARSLRSFLFDILVDVVRASTPERPWAMPLRAWLGGEGAVGQSLAVASLGSTATSREVLWAALAALSFKNRVILVMHELDQVPALEIARRLRTPRAIVRIRLWRARRVLCSEVARRRAVALPLEPAGLWEGASAVETLPDLIRARAVATARATVPSLRPAEVAPAPPRSPPSSRGSQPLGARWVKCGLIVFGLVTLVGGLVLQGRWGSRAPSADVAPARQTQPLNTVWQPRHGLRPVDKAGHLRSRSERTSARGRR
jgi:DNA-directed RNA polymerase specialized sigma24 family protein